MVRRKVEEVLQQANIAAFMSGPRYAARTVDLIELAIAQENMTAAMNGQRILGQTTNNLRETFNVTDDRGVTPEQLVARIAALRPDLAPLLGQMLGLPATQVLPSAGNDRPKPNDIN